MILLTVTAVWDNGTTAMRCPSGFTFNHNFRFQAHGLNQCLQGHNIKGQ